MIRAARRPALLALLLASVAACGGGGGPPPLSVTVDRTSLSWAGLLSGVFPARVVRATLTGGEGSYYGVIALDRPGVLSATFEITGETSANITFTPVAPVVGKVSGEVTLALCPDPNCRTVAWSKVIPYDITAFTLEPASLAFVAVEGQPATPQVITVTPAAEASRLTLRLAGPPGAPPTTQWLTATRTSPSTWEVTATGAGLLAGSAQGQLWADGGGGVIQRVPATLDLGLGILDPLDTSVTMDAGATGAEVPGSLEVFFAPGLTPTWTATADQPWLRLDPPAGPGAGFLNYFVDGAALASLPNWSTTTATVTVRAPGLTPATTLVTVRKELAEVTMVHPAAVPAGQGATLRVFGRGFSAIRAADAVEVTGAPGATGLVISDRELSVTLPALAAGRAEVKVKNPFGAATGVATFGAVASAYASELVAQEGEKRSAFLDASRGAVFAVDRTQDALVRYRRGAAGWQVDLLPVGSIGDAGLTADRRTIWVTKGGNTLLEVDPDSLSVRSTTPVTSLDLADAITTGFHRTTGGQATNDGRLWFSAGDFSYFVYLDQATGVLQRLAGDQSRPWSPAYLASPDGSRMGVLGLNFTQDWLYSAFAGAPFLTDLPPLNAMTGWSADGGLLATDLGEVFRAPDWQLVGSSLVAQPDFGTASVLSPDGTRAYRVVHATLSTPASEYQVARVEVFDTTALQPGTTSFVKLGELPVAGSAANCLIFGTSDCNFLAIPLMSPAGDTLFLVGNRGLVVVAIPLALRGG